MECSGEHRGFGVGVSSIKSVTLDNWTETQINLMKVGSNQRLKDFLTEHQMPDELDKKEIYSSVIMSFYRRMLRTESRGELFMEPMPQMSKWWNQSENEDNLFDSNSKYANNIFNNSSNSTANFYENPEYNKPYSDTNENQKNEIVISDNHYQQAKQYSDVASQFANKIPTEPKFTQVNSDYKNDPRFASVGSDSSQSSSNSSGSYLSGIGSILGTVWSSSVNAASAVKDKMSEYEVGSKLLYVGGKTLQGLMYVGEKAIEKGGEIAQSETVHNFASKAGEGLGYIKGKIVGGQSSNDSVSSDSYSQNMNENGYDRY